MELFLHVFLIRSASTHWASPKSLLQPLWTQRATVLLTLMTYVCWTHTTWARTTGSGCSPLTVTKTSSAPENFGVPPESGLRQACGLAWPMAKSVFTNIHCGCVITGGEQKLITSDYSTCECICGTSIKTVSALGEENITTLIKFSILFSLSLSGLPVWSSLLVWERKQTFQITLQYDVASKYCQKYLGITTAANMQLTSLDWDSAYNKKLPSEVRDLWNFPQEVKATSISSINFLFIHQSILGH